MKSSLYSKIASRVFNSKWFITYQAGVAILSKSESRRERASIILQAVILSAEPRTPVRLLKRLHERIITHDRGPLRYAIEELRMADYEDRKPYQIDFPWEMEYVANMLNRASQLWNVEVVNIEAFRDPQK